MSEELLVECCVGMCAVCFIECYKGFNGCFSNPDLYPLLTEIEACWVYCFNLLPVTSGLGTVYAACRGTKGMRCKILAMGLLQFLLTPMIVGWFLSISYGAKLQELSNKNRRISAQERKGSRSDFAIREYIIGENDEKRPTGKVSQSEFQRQEQAIVAAQEK